MFSHKSDLTKQDGESAAVWIPAGGNNLCYMSLKMDNGNHLPLPLLDTALDFSDLPSVNQTHLLQGNHTSLGSVLEDQIYIYMDVCLHYEKVCTEVTS